jgi:hypothetical protein
LNWESQAELYGESKEMESVMVSERPIEESDWDIERQLEQELETLERRATKVRAALMAWRSANLPDESGTPESRRWIRKSGKPMRPIEVMLILLSENGGSMKTNELFTKMEEGGAFRGKRNPESAFRLSIATNVRLEKIVQTDGRGRSIEEILDLRAPFAGVTKLVK